MSILTQTIEVFLLGLIGGAVPGPMLTAVFTEVLNGGFNKSFKVVFKALIAEVIVALAILLIVFSLNIPKSFFYGISIAGAIFLVYLAGKVYKINKIDGESSAIFTFPKIFILTLLNGGFWIYWITVCVPRAFALKAAMPAGLWVFMLAMETGWLIMTGLLGFIFSRFRALLLKKNLVSAVFKIFALLLVFFAVKSVVESIIYFVK